MEPSSDPFAPSTDPHSDDIRMALGRILAVNPFRESPQLSAFLKFVVEETLLGKGRELKGYTIATLALGRNADFDPQTDPIVRVQAGRVRHALEAYYKANPVDPIRIQFAKGTYEPQFLFSEKTARILPLHRDTAQEVAKVVTSAENFTLSSHAASSSTASSSLAKNSSAEKNHLQQHTLFGLATIAALLGLVVLVMLGTFEPRPEKRVTTARESYFPRIVVDATMSPTTPIEMVSVIQRTQDALARFDDIILVIDAQDERGTSRLDPVQNKAERLVLRMIGAYADRGRIRISARLVEQFDQRVVWVKEFEPVLSGTGGDDARTDIVRAIATSIARPYGSIHAYSRQIFGAGEDSHSDFGCLILVFDYRLRNDKATHLAARQCLEDQIAKTPKIGALHSQLASLYVDEFLLNFNPLPKPPLDRALAAANRGVSLAPTSARSHQALMTVHFSRREMASAWRAADEALKLNPFDTEIQADVAGRYIQSGHIQKGMTALEDALTFNSTPPDWATTYLALAKFMSGRPDEAVFIAKGLRSSEFALSLITSIVLSHHDNDRASAIEALSNLRQKHPLIFSDPVAYLERNNFDRGFIDRVMVRYRIALNWMAQGS